MRTRWTYAAAVVLGMLALAGCGGGGEGGDGGGGAPVDLELQPLDGTTSGTVTLNPNGDETNILVNAVVAVAGAPQPTGIYKGTCEKPDVAPTYELPMLEEGIGATTLNVSLETLLAQKHVVLVSESAAKRDTFVACAPIERTE
jgi:hypothetical protein